METVEEVSQFNLTEFKKEDYLVKVEMEDQPEIFAGITEVIAPQTETGKVSFKLDRKDYTTSQAGQTIEGAVVEFGTKSNDKVSTKYITMQSLIDQMKANPGGTYTLEHDIDASMVQGDDYLVPTFSGTFNGNGYKIKGLTTTLFGTVSGGKVQNVKLENVSITKVNSYKDAGGGTIANKAQKDAVIENVHVSGSLKSTNSRELLGGLVGRMDYAKVSKCSANLEITGSFNTTGGLIGQMSNQNEGPNIVENSYAVGSIRGNRTNGALGGLIGWHNCKTNFSVTNCYAAINMELTGTNRQPGGFIGYIGEADATGVLKSNVSYSTGNAGYKFDGSTETIKYTTAQIENLYSLRESRLKRESSRTGNTNLTQITDVTVDKLSQKEFYTNMGWSEDVWDFAPLKEGKTPILRNNDSNMTTMLQTKEIASAADLKNIKNDLSGVYVLTTDIDISESASGTAVIPGIFKGTLKGNGHQIIGQKIPLFDTLDGATIENVKLVQGEINQKGTDKVAALAKTSQADTLIKDVYVRDMSVTGQSNVAGLVASMNKTTVEECSVNATVNGKRAGGFAAEILGDSVVKNSYARRTADKETFAATEGDLQGGFAAVIKKSELINNFSELTLSQKAEEKPEEIPKKSSEKAAKTACMVGNFVAESGVGSEAVTKAEHNISFGPKEYSFAGNSTAENVLTNYTENYEYTGSVSNDEGTQTPEHTGKIDKATAAQITNKTFYIDTLKWDEKIWYLDDVAGGKRPRLKAEGDVYGAEEEDTSKGEGSEGDSNNAPSEEVVYIQAPVQDEETEEPQMAGETPTEVISFIAQKNAEEIAAMDSLESVKDYQADRKLIYENLRLFMPFYTYEQIVKDGNKVDPSHVLNKKTVLAVYPMDDRGNRIVALSDKTVQDIKKIRIQFTDETTPLIYNITYIDTNSTWRTIGAAELENMNLKTLDDLWDNQLTIRPGHRFDLRSMNDVGVNNLGAYQIDRVCYASWYVPYVDGGTPNAQTFRRNGYELGGLYGYSDGLVEYLSNRTQTGDLAYFKKKMQDENFSFETYRKNKNKEIEEKIKKQKEQGNAYFDEEALIEYLKQNMINYGNGINSGVSTGNNTLNNIKESRENVFRYLQRITDEFRSPVYADTAESRHAVTISTGQELIEKINENPNGFYVLEKDISMADINLTGEVYIDKTFIGKLQGNGHKITDAQGPLFAKIANSYVSDLTIVNKEGETKDWFGKTKQYTIIVNEQKKETVQEIKTLEELKTVGQNKYTKYVLKNDIDASSVTTETAVVKGIFKGEFDGGGFTIKGLKKPLFEKVQEGTVRNLKIENAEINSTEESSKNAVITKESNHAVFESLNLADIKVSGVSYNAVVTGYDYTSSVFSKIQIRNAQITGTKNYNAVLAGRASGSQIQDVSVIGSSVALSGTDCGGFIGEGKNVTISRVYSDADMTVNTYTDDKNRTQSAGFIGNLTGKSSVEYVFAAGKVDNKTSEQLYNFIGAPDALKTMVKNSFVIQNAGGVSNITDGVGQEILREVTSQEAATSDFYKTSMTLNEETWNLSLVPMKGYPELKGMEKREVISVKTAEDFMKMKDFPTQEYRLKADIDLSGTEQTGSVIPEFSGVLDGENHKITGLKAPLFGQLSGTVSNVAIDAGAIEIGNSVDTTVGIFANTMTNATVEKVMIANGSISSTAGKAAGFAGTVTDSTVKNIFIQGRVNAVSTASGFAETSHHSVMENIYANIDVNGADGAGFLVNSTGENSYKNICSIGNVAENMYKLAKTDITFTNAYELSAADGISSAAEANGVKTIGKEVWTKAFYTETLKLDISVWDVENAETNGYPLLKEFNVNLSPMTVEIQKPQDIRKLNKLPEGRFTITADLDFTEYGAAEITENIAENSIENNADINAADSVENSAENHAEETAQAGTCLVTETFTGSINGGGHKVSGMKSAMFKQLSGKVENLEFRNILVDNETAGANVLAETTQSANVKNVHFNGITLRGAGYTGMIGKDTGSTFSQISVQNADVTTRADYAGVFAANAAGTQIFDVLITDTEVATSNAYVGGFIGNAERITAQKVFADAELDIPYTVSPQNTAAFIGQASEDSKIQYSTAAGGVYPEDPSSTRYKLTHMDNSSNLNELKAFTNCFINTDTPGYDSIANDPKGVTHEALCGTEFYTNEMGLSQDVWDLSDVAGTGTPSLKTMPEEDVRAPETAPTPEEEIPMQETAPEGYTEIRTAEELLAIRDSSDKYILMSSISLYDAEPQDGSFLGNFKGELNGNGLTIREVYGAPLFNTLSGKVENLKLTDVKVEAWSQNQGANAFAKTLSGATVSKVALKNILVAGGNNTGALAGTAQNSTVSEVWAEGLNVNPYGPIHGQNDAMVGGLIADLKGGCHISDCYVGGEITVNGETQGGVFGYNSNMDNGPENTVKQVVSNMKTKAISGQTDGAGFIGMIGYDYSWSTWMKNSIAIGEAGVSSDHGSVGQAYRFATKGNSESPIRFGLQNCYEANVSGRSSVVSGYLDETGRYKETSFYQDTLKFDSSKWNFTSVEKKGHPTLSWVADAEPLPPLPEGSAVTTHKQLKTEVPQGYTAIRTPADFMKIAENPSGKYILMNNISLEQVKLAEGQTSYIMKRFEGELDGNNQVIHGLRASLFDSISGTSSKKAVVKNLRVQNVFVNAGYKDIFDWQGKPVLAEANGLAREVSNGRLETIYMNCVKLNGGGNTGALGGLVNETYIGKVWLEGIDINSGLSEEELGRFNLVGGAVGSLSGYNSKFEDSYVEGKIIMDNNQQGGVAGQVKAAVVRNVISNVEARSNKPDSWTEKSGFVGDVNTSLQYDNRWYLDRCISIGNSGNNYKFLGKDLKAVTKNNLNLCYEVTGKTGRSNVTDATSQSGTLLTIDNINNVELYRDTLSFNDNTAQADPNAWDFSSVAEKGYPTLTWLLTYDGAAATMVEQTPVQDQEQEATQDENLAEPEVNLPDQDEYLKED